MFSRVVEGADPYRGIEKPFISSPPNGCANITREEQAPPLPRWREIRSFVRSRKIVRTTMRATNGRPYKRNSSKRRRGDSIFRFASRHTCFASMRSPVKPNGKNKQNSGAPTPTHIVGTGVLDCPFRYESKFFPRRTVRQLVARTPCPYNKWGIWCAAILFVLAVCF